MRNNLDTVAILGLGLIGSSIARAMRLKRPLVRIRGYDSSSEVREEVRRLELVSTLNDSAQDAVRGADIVILCVPVGATDAVARSLQACLSRECIVTDVGSTKAQVSAALRRALPEGRIVPAHPIAGSERSGPGAGSAHLFESRWCILTPEAEADAEDVAAVADLWRSLGAEVEIMPPERHDLVLAAISHVPHLLAFSAVAAAAALEEERGYPILAYAGGGFRDFTRIAAANPQVWKDIFLSNKEAVVQISTAFRTVSDRLASLIEGSDEGGLLEELECARQQRFSLEADA